MIDDEIKAEVRRFILSEFLPGEEPESLLDSTELITNRILDSLGTLKLISFIEEKFRITVEPHETGFEYLNSVDLIVKLIAAKMEGQRP